MNVQNDIAYQAAVALTALAGALCKQGALNGAQLRQDFLDNLEGIANFPQGAGTVGIEIAVLMDAFIQAEAPKN